MVDLYAVLGVDKHAGADDIKRAYRKLVRECHPDVNPAPDAEQRFAEVSSAYAVISDPKQRALYDEFGPACLEPGFDPHVARRFASHRATHQANADSPFGDMNAFHDVMGAAFNTSVPHEPPPEHKRARHRTDEHRTHRSRERARDLGRMPARITVEVDPLVTFTGGLTTVSVPRPGGRLDTIRVRIKAGAKAGDTIKLPGYGPPPPAGGLPGDLELELRVPEHPVLRRSGDDLEMDVPVTLLEAVQGGPITVPTPTGMKRVNLPPNCAGARLRLRGRGVQRADRPGHLILHLRPVLPENIDTAVVDACRQIEQAYRGDVRERIRL